MTEISQLLARINTDPTYLKRMNWKEETMRFSERRMEEIALGIDDDEVCDIAVGMMMESFSLERRERFQERKRRQRKRDDLTVEEEQCITHRVEDFVRRIKDIREETATQRNHLKELKNKLSVLGKKYQEKQTDLPQQQQIINKKDETDTTPQNHQPEEIIRYVMKLHPLYVSEGWKDHYQDLWRKVLEIPEVKAVIYNKGRQKNTTFNRNLVGNILHLMADEKVQVLCENNATKFSLALENDEDASIRAQLGKMPEKEKRDLITETIKTFLP